MQARKFSTIGLLTAALVGFGLSGPSAVAAQATDANKAAPDYKPDFKKYDSDGDGYVSLQEFVAQKKDENAFKEADADKDGRLNEDEFVKARSISDRMKVGEFVDDAWITTKVKALLLKEDLLTGLKIDVDTHDGMVQLSGAVDSTDQISRAVKIASNVEGVKAVINDLQLKK
jgi:hyperosmotically inducible periplasmic protein